MSSEKDKFEKTKTISNSQVKHVPKDAQVVMSILKELNVLDYEPRVINQLLEFTYRYVSCILDDAKSFANHARKKTIDLDDVKLATELVMDRSFTTPASRHIYAKLSDVRNTMPLPAIKPHCGLRLPPDRYCLSACNYKMRSSHPPKKLSKTVLDSRSTNKTQIKSGALGGNAMLKRQAVLPPRTQVVTIPKPVIKFTTSKVMPIENKTGANDGGGDVKMDDFDVAASVPTNSGGVKREHEEDDFELVP